MTLDKKPADINIQKLLYYGIFVSILFLNLFSNFLTGFYSSKIPTGQLDILLFSCGAILLISSLIIPIFLARKSDDYQTIQLVTWACLEAAVTIGFVHSYMAKENFMLFYTIPAIFQMIKSYPKIN